MKVLDADLALFIVFPNLSWTIFPFVLYFPRFVSHVLDNLINTINDVLSLTFVPVKIIVYPSTLCVNLTYQIEISGEVHLQVCYKPNIAWVLN
jgi:hypothetical protein